MKLASEWKDYKILDMADGQKLEKWGDVVLARPCHIYASADSSSDSRAAGQFITKFLMRWSDVMSVYITSEKISYFIYMLNKRNKNANNG